MRAIRTVLTCGYGVMGRGVAGTFAAAGFRTLIHSRRADALTDLPAGACATVHFDELRVERPDVAIESAPDSNE